MIIGIPHYNDFDGLARCINSLVQSTKEIDTIIVINSDAEAEKKVKDIPEWNHKFKMEIHNTPKLGPLDAYNRLFNIAKKRKEDLFLTQTDVTFPKCQNRDWLSEMKETSKKEDCGIVTCFGGGGQSGPEFINGYPWVGAWCTYIPYRTLEKVGGYDMNIPLGWGVDIDYTFAVESAGLNVYMLNYWVDHSPNYEQGHEHEKQEDIEKIKSNAFKYMREKWKLVK